MSYAELFATFLSRSETHEPEQGCFAMVLRVKAKGRREEGLAGPPVSANPTDLTGMWRLCGERGGYPALPPALLPARLGGDTHHHHLCPPPPLKVTKRGQLRRELQGRPEAGTGQASPVPRPVPRNGPLTVSPAGGASR